jgi:hypothetical protein
MTIAWTNFNGSFALDCAPAANAMNNAKSRPILINYPLYDQTSGVH